MLLIAALFIDTFREAGDFGMGLRSMAVAGARCSLDSNLTFSVEVSLFLLMIWKVEGFILRAEFNF